MNIKLIAAASLLILASNSSFANSEKTAKADELPQSTKTIIVKQSLEVVGIDYKARWVELKDASGLTQKINVGEEARNFSQINVGDIVNINRSKTIKMKVFGADAINAGAEAAAVFARTPEGQKPGAAIVGSEIIVVTIAAIDLEKSMVTLEDKDGNRSEFKPEIPANLKKVKVGDKVAIMLIQTLSISVDKN